jgi:hypothetical protein
MSKDAFGAQSGVAYLMIKSYTLDLGKYRGWGGSRRKQRQRAAIKIRCYESKGSVNLMGTIEKKGAATNHLMATAYRNKLKA